jgi:hypothetical protein
MSDNPPDLMRLTVAAAIHRARAGEHPAVRPTVTTLGRLKAERFYTQDFVVLTLYVARVE